MNRLTALLPIILVFAACTQAPQAEDPSVITARSAEWQAALNDKDIDTLVDLYTSDARILPPNREMARGGDAVRAEFGAMIDAGMAGELTSVEASIAGDLAYNIGVYTLRTGDGIVDTGKYMELWKRGNDGQWRIASDIWNSDNPPAEMQEPMAHMMITHEVENPEKWSAAWRGDNSRHALFERNGAAHVHAFQDAGNPTMAAVVIAVSDMDAINKLLESEEGLSAATEDSVVTDTMRVLTEVK